VSSPSISVIVCTHNPRADYFAATREALRVQTMTPSDWELMIVDNNSRPGAVPADSVSWHPHGRIIAEKELGLTHARLRGIAEARGGVLVFVDDDNVLAADFLTQVLEISRTHPFLGAWGASITARFETPPAQWAEPFLGYLAIGEIREARWSNTRSGNPCCPCGAGLCIRQDVASTYALRTRGDPVRRSLGRSGTNFSACEDSDMALTACDLGLGIGVFPQLRLEHLIPKRRLELDYLSNLVAGIYSSQAILGAIRGDPAPLASPSGGLERLLKFWQRLHLSPETRRLDEAVERGRRAGAAFVAQHRARGAAPFARG
jgi:glycosyltransferase involved in cell wall biosynthesis